MIINYYKVEGDVKPAYMEGYKPEQYIETNIIGAFN